MKHCNTCKHYMPITATIGYCHRSFQSGLEIHGKRTTAMRDAIITTDTEKCMDYLKK